MNVKNNKKIKFSFSILLLILNLSVFCQKQTENAVYLMTHNILALSGHPKEIHIFDTAIMHRAVVYYKNMDIIALQESPPKEYVKILADKLGLNYMFFTGKFKGNQEYPYGFPGAILSRYPIIDSFDFNRMYPDIADSLFQRHWGGICIETPMGMLQVVTVHLCANFGGRFREQTRNIEADMLLKLIPHCDSCVASFLLGDFNSFPNSEPYKKMMDVGYIDAHKDNAISTVPVPNPKFRIDYVFYKTNTKLNVTPLPVNLPFYQELNLYLSDHIPCIVKIYNEK